MKISGIVFNRSFCCCRKNAKYDFNPSAVDCCSWLVEFLLFCCQKMQQLYDIFSVPYAYPSDNLVLVQTISNWCYIFMWCYVNNLYSCLPVTGAYIEGGRTGAPPLNAAIIVVSTRVLRSSKSTKINSGRGFAPDPTGGAHSAPLDPWLVGRAIHGLAKNPTPPRFFGSRSSYSNTDRRPCGQVR